MKKYPLLLRDNPHSLILFFTFTVAMFLIIGPVAVYVKAATAGLAVFFFLISFAVLTVIKSTNKSLPRYFQISDDSVNLIYWDRHVLNVPFSDIEYVKITGSAGKGFDSVVTIKTKNDVIKLRTEIIDNILLIVNKLQNLSAIEYNDKFIEKIVIKNLNTSAFSKNLRLVFGYGFVFIFLIMAVFINLQLPTLINQL